MRGCGLTSTGASVCFILHRDSVFKSLDWHRHVVRLEAGHLVLHLLYLLLCHGLAQSGPFVEDFCLAERQLVDLQCDNSC